MKTEVTLHIAEVLLKHGLRIADLNKTRSRIKTLAYARREVAYTLAKDHNYLRREIAEVLHCKLPQATYLIKQHCLNHKPPLVIPKYITKETTLVTLSKFIDNTPTLQPKLIKEFFHKLYWLGYQAGRNAKLRSIKKAAKQAEFDLKSFPGVTRVASARNNAPVSILEAPRAILNEGEDDQTTATKSA